MRVKHEHLQRITWDQAAILRLSSPAGFTQLGINPAHVRLWASQGTIKPVAIGPRGNVLYLIAAVIAESQTRAETRRGSCA